MLGGLYDFFAHHAKLTQFVGLVVFILVIVASATAISCHNCSKKEKTKCAQNSGLGYSVNVIILILACFMVLYHIYSLYVLFDGKSHVVKAHNMIMNHLKRTKPVPTSQQLETAVTRAFGSKNYLN